MRQRRVPVPGPIWSELRSPRPRVSIRATIRGFPSVRCGRSCRSSTSTSTTPGWRRSPRISAARDPERRRDSPRPAASACVRHLADLFDHYGVHRPAWSEAWAAGDDTDGHGQPLPADVAWQAPLWRCLRERAGDAQPGRAPRPARATGCAPNLRWSTSRRGCRCSASPACPGATSTCWRASPSAATSTCSSSIRRRRCGTRIARRQPRPRVRPPAEAGRPDGHAAAQPAPRHLGPGRPGDAAGARGRASRRPRARGSPLAARRAGRHAPAPPPGRRPRRPAATRATAARAAGRPCGARCRRQQRPGARLPRTGPPGRGAPRRDPAPAGRRPDARAAGRDRDVSGHRGLRPAHPSDVRRRRTRRRRRDRPGRPSRRGMPDLRFRLADRSLRQTNPVLRPSSPSSWTWPTPG